MTVKKEDVGTVLGLLTAGILIVIGVLYQQPLDVLQKAIRICLECVGIG